MGISVTFSFLCCGALLSAVLAVSSGPAIALHLLCCMLSFFNMHQWVLFSMTQQCMLIQNEVMLSLSNTFLTT